MKNDALTIYLEQKDKFCQLHGDPTGFVIRHAMWLDLIRRHYRFAGYLKLGAENCPKFEGLNVYRTADGPDNFIRFFDRYGKEMLERPLLHRRGGLNPGAGRPRVLRGVYRRRGHRPRSSLTTELRLSSRITGRWISAAAFRAV